jgi:hypothetical protein
VTGDQGPQVTGDQGPGAPWALTGDWVSRESFSLTPITYDPTPITLLAGASLQLDGEEVRSRTLLAEHVIGIE